MASRYERAASMVEAHIDRWGTIDAGEDLVEILRICHGWAKDDRPINGHEALESIADYIEAIYAPDTVSFAVKCEICEDHVEPGNICADCGLYNADGLPVVNPPPVADATPEAEGLFN